MNCNGHSSKIRSMLRALCMILVTVSTAGVQAAKPRYIKISTGPGVAGNGTNTTGICLFVYFNHMIIVIRFLNIRQLYIF